MRTVEKGQVTISSLHRTKRLVEQGNAYLISLVPSILNSEQRRPRIVPEEIEPWGTFMDPGSQPRCDGSRTA